VLSEAARALPGFAATDVTVSLLRPPPLERPLDVVPLDGGMQLRDGEEVVAVAAPHGPDAWSEIAPVDVATARAAEAGYAGLRAHPFPTCFSCGPARVSRDGLGISPGRVDAARVASSWTPDRTVAGADGAVSIPVAWAALDCIGGWSSDLEHRPLVLASICVRVESPPQAGTAYVVVGSHLRTEGRKTWTSAAMFDASGVRVGRAEQLWIAVDWAVVQELQSV